MREIKFRAFHKDKKIMYKVNWIASIGDSLTGHNIGVMHSPDFPSDINPLGEWFANTKDFELMQYTGLKDKNGKEIYEDDVVSSRILFGNWKVYWDKEDCGFFLVDNEGYTTCLDSEECEVIGNIFESPELLKD